MAAIFNREATDDNRSDIYDDDEDRGFFQMNESDEGMVDFPEKESTSPSLQKWLKTRVYFFVSLCSSKTVFTLFLLANLFRCIISYIAKTFQ